MFDKIASHSSTIMVLRQSLIRTAYALCLLSLLAHNNVTANHLVETTEQPKSIGVDDGEEVELSSRSSYPFVDTSVDRIDINDVVDQRNLKEESSSNNVTEMESNVTEAESDGSLSALTERFSWTLAPTESPLTSTSASITSTPYIPPYTNATMPGRLNSIEAMKRLPEDAIGPFRIRLVWSPEACWQGDCKYEIDWCMQCEGYECQEGDILWIELCRNIDQQLFTWIPVKNEKEFLSEPEEEPDGAPFDADKKKKRRQLQKNLLEVMAAANLMPQEISPGEYNFTTATDAAHTEDSANDYWSKTTTPAPTAAPTSLTTSQPSFSATTVSTTAATEMATETVTEILEMQAATIERRHTITSSPTESFLESLSPSSSPSTLPPTKLPSKVPTVTPTTNEPSISPSLSPTVSANPTNAPTTGAPSNMPSLSPTVSAYPTNEPTTGAPSNMPSLSPTVSANPTNEPTTGAPSEMPSDIPSSIPSDEPSTPPTLVPTTETPSSSPSEGPSNYPSEDPTNAPFIGPSTQLGIFKVSDPSKNLCLDRIHLNKYKLKTCDKTKSQLFFGVPPKEHYDQHFELRPRRMYAIDRVDEKCINMHHQYVL
jgi:hypothetical protein